MKTLSSVFAFALFVCSACAAEPSWWTSGTAPVLDVSGTATNYEPVNLGQLKYMAKQAKAHLDANPDVGSGTEITELVNGFEPRSGQGYTQPQIDAFIVENYAPINLGQLKAVAKPFYNRLHVVGYDTKTNLIAHGFPDKWSGTGAWTGYYPWNPSTTVEENYAPANLGQLKMVFSFDISSFDPGADSDGDGMPDIWENEHGLAESSNDAADDPDGDGRSNLTEYLAHSDPNQADGEIGAAFAATELQVFSPLE